MARVFCFLWPGFWLMGLHSSPAHSAEGCQSQRAPLRWPRRAVWVSRVSGTTRRQLGFIDQPGLVRLFPPWPEALGTEECRAGSELGARGPGAPGGRLPRGVPSALSLQTVWTAAARYVTSVFRVNLKWEGNPAASSPEQIPAIGAASAPGPRVPCGPQRRPRPHLCAHGGLGGGSGTPRLLSGGGWTFSPAPGREQSELPGP
uniref:Uncharacterized protein n=1 Tax=Rangifer tarandus platyrhynchus TaxID=3082113 RepID=A0ACB0FBJ7_RANTA|nr:unnamed protein product [Rangifer tarandus platyrhynchus]